MTQSVWQKNDLRSLREADTIVIGGGITGASLAYHLAKSDHSGRVLLLEEGGLASKASGRNAGFLLMGTAENYSADIEQRGRSLAKYLWDLSRMNIESLGQVCDHEACDMRFDGTIVAEPAGKQSEQLQTSFQLMQEDGFDVSLLSSQDLETSYSLKGMEQGLLLPQNGQVNPVKLIRHLVDISGCELRVHSKVNKIEEKGSKIQVSGNDFMAQCERVFVATNSYLPLLVPSTANVIRPVRAQMLSLHAKKTVPLPVYTHSGYFYFRQMGEKVIVGGARHLHRDEEVGYDDLTTNHVQIDLENYARDCLLLSSALRHPAFPAPTSNP